MKVRTYGLLILVLAGITPLCIYGMIAIERSRETSIGHIRIGNERLAQDIASSIRELLEQEKRLIATLGVALVETAPDRREDLVDSFAIQHVDLQAIAVYDRAGALIAGAPPEGDEALYRDIAGRIAARARRAGADAPAHGAVHDPGRPADGDGQWRLRRADEVLGRRALHSVLVGVPIEIAGAVEGAIVAPYALTRVWPAVEAVRVGETGFVRLLCDDGTLLAHGHLDELRRGLITGPDRNRALLDAARAGHTARNFRGQPIVASAAPIGDLGWWVLIEQTVDEAFAATDRMKRDLLAFAALVLVLMVAVGLLFGRAMVRGLERLRDHTQVLARGDLTARADAGSRLVEVRALAVSLNDMAAGLARLEQEGRARERLSVFGGVAAGLAHDLRLPVEAVLGTSEMLRADPADARARDLLLTVSARELPRLKRYLDDMQRLARQGRLELRHERADPLALARSVVDELSAAPKWRGVTFAAEGGARPAAIDVSLVRRALLNLAGNGADACLARASDGAVTIDVADRDDGRTLVFRVIDTGEGIPDGRLPAVLGTNFVSTKRSSGFGLGLGVVRQVAAAHGGHLTASSTVGQGSIFELVLPRESSAASPDIE